MKPLRFPLPVLSPLPSRCRDGKAHVYFELTRFSDSRGMLLPCL